MYSAVTHYSVWVTDQDAAIEFYVGKLGLEVRSDIRLDFLRWLTVAVPGQPQEIILAPLEPPVIDPENAERARDLLSKGYMGTIILSTPDCRAAYARLRAAGLEFTQEPVPQPWGTDCALRDPFGNHIRIAEPAAP